MACRKLSSELQLLVRSRCKTVLAATALFRHSSSSSSDDDDDCKQPEPVPEPRPDLTTETHTHQLWAADDYRNARFMNAKRWVDKNFPMKWGHARDPVYSSARVVKCGGGALDHPVVFINMDKEGYHSCFYCGQKFERIFKKDEEKEEEKKAK